MNQNGKIAIGIALALMVLLPMAMANLNRVNPGVPATVTDNNQSYSVLMVAQDINHTSSCQDADQGFNPLVKSDMNAVYSDRNGMLFNYSDKCDTNSTLLTEFACGSQILVNGQSFPNNSYGFKFDCADLNKTCSAGKCV